MVGLVLGPGTRARARACACVYIVCVCVCVRGACCCVAQVGTGTGSSPHPPPPPPPPPLFLSCLSACPCVCPCVCLCCVLCVVSLCVCLCRALATLSGTRRESIDRARTCRGTGSCHHGQPSMRSPSASTCGQAECKCGRVRPSCAGKRTRIMAMSVCVGCSRRACVVSWFRLHCCACVHTTARAVEQANAQRAHGHVRVCVTRWVGVRKVS